MAAPKLRMMAAWRACGGGKTVNGADSGGIKTIPNADQDFPAAGAAWLVLLALLPRAAIRFRGTPLIALTRRGGFLGASFTITAAAGGKGSGQFPGATCILRRWMALWRKAAG